MLAPRYYKAHLQKVSRSFAFCIEELRDDLQGDVALAYLLFRFLDTIEDSEWPERAMQKQAFELFQKLVSAPRYLPADFKELCGLLSIANMKNEEVELLKDSEPLFLALFKSDAKKRAIFVTGLLTMSKGMEHFSLVKQHQIANLPELNLYCYFVAGCIGELLTELSFSPHQQDDRLFEDSIHFGLFLQKINILKDFLDDEKEGRNFLWSWEEVAHSLRPHAERAFRYLESIPSERNDYKIFCAWSLFLGLVSYPYIEQTLRTRVTAKISRLEAWQMLSKIKSDLVAGRSLHERFAEYSAKLPPAEATRKNSSAALMRELNPNASAPRLQNFDFA